MEYKNVFDIPIKDQFGNQNMLEKYRGKVLMFINTTGHCGNASQWPILNSIMDKYRNKNFQMIYVPTNDYCGSVTVEPYKKGIQNGAESFEYANKTYGIEDPFTELTSSRNEPWSFKVDNYIRQTGGWERNYELHETVDQLPKGELYTFLMPNQDFIGGNFHKIVTNSKGVPVASIPNHVLNNGPRSGNMVEILKNQVLLNGTNITKLLNKYTDLEKIINLEFPDLKIKELLFEIGKEKIQEFDSNINYWLEEELLEWNQVKDLYADIQDFREARAKQDIIDIENLIDEVLYTDKCNYSKYSYSPY